MIALSCDRGDSPSWTLTMTGTNADITGWTPRWTLKAQSDWPNTPDASASITCLVGSGLTVTQSSPGIIVLALTATQTAALSPGVYVWDLQLTNGATVETAQDSLGAAYGSLTVTPDVTRTTP